MPETHQALLFDRNRGTHVLAEVGKTIEGYLVDDVDDDEVTLVAEGGAQIVLAAPEPAWRRGHHDVRDEGEARPAKLSKVDKRTPVDPYAPATPVDPYADDDGAVRSIEAPDAGMAPTAPVRTATAGAPAATATPTTPTATAPTATPTATATVSATPTATVTVVPATATVKPAAGSTVTVVKADATALAGALTDAPANPNAPLVLARADVNAALANFGLITTTVKGTFTPTGAKLETIVPGSLFAKAGLKNGDVVTAVDNQPMRTLDDAANLYARAVSAKSLTLAIMRAGKPMTLRVVIQ